MTEREAFIAAVAENPDDDTGRLAFADWLQENGEDARAEFVRLQCAIALREPPADAWDEPRHDLYRDPLPPDEARAVDLLMRHWPEWFGPVLGAVGMPVPEPLARPRAAEWRYPPYALPQRVWSVRHLPLAFESEYAPRRRRAKRPKRFLDAFRLDRGFAVGLRATLADATAGCSLAAALRLEPIAALALRVPPDPGRWAKLSHPALARVRELELADTDGTGRPESAAALGAVLNDPALGGVRSLALAVEYDGEYDGLPLPLARAEVEPLLGSVVVRGLHALRTGLEPDAAAAFADAEPLPELRALSLACHSAGGAVPLPLSAYRDRLERLHLSGTFHAALGGRPWVRLAALRLDDRPTGAAELDALADPATFPALADLRIALAGAFEAGALAGAVRAGRFPHLTALAVSGHLAGAVGALAEAVSGTAVRELDLRGVWGHTDAECERARAALGDRVRIDPPGDPIPF